MSWLKRLPVGLAALLASGALVACGGDDGSSSESGSPAAVAEEFSKSFVNGDGETACGLLATATVDVLEKDGGSCPDAITELGKLISDEEKSAIENASYEVSSEDDTSATVEVDLGEETDSMQLQQEEGEWKVTAPAG
jgi:hypothetical protein